MAAPSTEQSDFTLPPPTPEELFTIIELQAENLQLLEVRKCYLRLFDVLHSELEQAFIADAQLRTENDHLRAQLLSVLGPTKRVKSPKEQACNYALREEGAKSIEEFLLYLVNKTHKPSSEGFDDRDVLQNFPSAFRFSGSQPHKGTEVFFDPKASTSGCKSDLSTPKMQPTALAFQMRGPLASRDAETSGSSNPNAAFYSCSNSKPFGHHVPDQPMAMMSNPQNLEPHTIEVPIQRHVQSPANTPPTFSERPPHLTFSTGRVPEDGLTHATLRTKVHMQHIHTQVTTPCESTTPSILLQPEEAKDLRPLEFAMSGFAPPPNEVQTGNLLSPTDVPQATPSNPIMCLLPNFANGSSLPAMNAYSSRIPETTIESNLTAGECLLTSQSDQPNGAAVELNSTQSSTGVVSRPIPHGVTTLVIRNVPARYTKELLMQEWPVDGTYDFLYLPFSFKQKRTAGFAFVNFISHEAAVDFYSRWHNKSLRDQGTAKRLSINTAETQGLEENLRHVVACNISRVKNSKYLPSVFNGIDEVPLEELLEQITISGMSASTGEVKAQ